MSRLSDADWIEADDPLDCGVRLPARVVDRAWRGEAVARAYAEHRSLRKVAVMFGLNHEKVRTLVRKYGLPRLRRRRAIELLREAAT